MESLKSKGITANMLKVIAIVAMLIDHLTWDYVVTASLAGQLLHIIGRLTAPIMSFFIVEGFFHTKDCRKYGERLFIFSLVSYFAYQFHTYGEFFYGFRTKFYIAILTNSVIFTLLLGFLTLVVWYKTSWKKWKKIIAVCGLCLMAVTSDWAIIVVLWVFFMGLYHDSFKKQMIALVAIGVFFNGFIIIIPLLNHIPYWWSNVCQLGIIGAVPLLHCYNGKLGKSRKVKWFFYVFYPLHLFILGILKFYVF